MQNTLDRVLREASFFAGRMAFPTVRSIYIGGGTPSVVPPELLSEFFSGLKRAIHPAAAVWDDGVEWTFEANPESVTPSLLDTLRSAGVNRISLGVQSLQDPLLGFLGRRARRDVILRALEMIWGSSAAAPTGGAGRRAAVNAAGRRHFALNVDLITGIPGQTGKMIRDDLDVILRFAPDHVSLYSLTVEERTPLAQMLTSGRVCSLSEESQDALWILARDALVDAGFRWYEISNFARPGAESAHNLGYWRLLPYAGLGPGAQSTVPGYAAAGSPAVPAALRVANPNLFLYSTPSDTRFKHGVEILSPRDLLFEHFITGLRTDDGIRIASLGDLFDFDMMHAWSSPIARWIDSRTLDVDALFGPENRFALTPDARLLLDSFLLEVSDLLDRQGRLDVFHCDTWAGVTR